MHRQLLHSLTQIEGVRALMEMYRTDVEAAQVKGGIERIKLEAFKTQVDAYAARVGARTAEFQMYEAQIRGETSKLDAYRTSVDAYTARVQGYAVKAQAEESVSRVQIAQASSKLDAYRTDMERYKVDISKVTDQVRAILQRHSTMAQVFAVESNAENAYYSMSQEVQRSNSMIYRDASNQAIANARHRLELVLKIIEQKVNTASEGATINGNLVTAALSQITGIAAQINQ